MRVPALPSSIPDRHGYTRTLTKLYPVKGDCDKACGEAVIYYTYNPEPWLREISKRAAARGAQYLNSQDQGNTA